MKRLIHSAILLLFTVAGLTAVTPAHAESEPFVEYEITDSRFGFWLNSSLTAFTDASAKGSAPRGCQSWNDPVCISSTQILADLIQTPCLDNADRGCIERVEVSRGGKELENLSLLGEGNGSKIADTTFTLSDGSGGKITVPRGGGISLWRSSERDASGNYRIYMAHLLARYSYYCGNLRNVPTLSPIVITGKTCAAGTFDFKGSIIPVSLQPKVIYCDFFTFEDSCVVAENFSGQEQVSVTVRQDKSLTGWLFGRMQNAQFSITPLDAQFNKIRVTGESTFVPPLKASVAKKDIYKYPKLERYLKTVFNGSDKFEGKFNYNFKNQEGGWLTYEEFLKIPETKMLSQIYNRWDLFSAFEESLKPLQLTAVNNGVYSAPATNSIMWNFSSAIYESADSSPCSADRTKLHGLVVTNAPLYVTGPPQFESGVLNYRVAGIHNNLDGSEFKGEYNFVVRSDTARCYYGFSNAPIEARVTVVSNDGTEQIATVVVSERENLLQLSARGFTFSSPTIKVKLSQPVPITKVPAKTKITKITCVKGKSVKVVSGVNPKCPSGFKIRTSR
jgi:hypothetical protein